MARAGGTMVRAGEAGQDEAVIPLPNNWRSASNKSGTIININGNLEFPNITDPNDAEKFIRNLEALSG